MRWSRGVVSPTLSVLVPVYNVERWLASCLDSILSQSVRGLEVIIVDDASTDGSLAVAEEYAARDDRIRIQAHDVNAGVSAARNTALDLARGSLVTWVDPDDVLPEHAWRPMLRSLRRSGSDFAVGKAERVGAQGRFVTPLMQRNHQVARTAISIDDQPLMLADVFLWNKVFRRDFWDAHAFRFPVGLRFEDQVVMTEAFLRASSFDVLTDVVYDWHYRSDKSSESQRRDEVSAVEERWQTKRMSLDQVRAHGSPAVLDVFLREVLPIDMWEHYRAAVAGPEAQWSDDYWRVLHEMQTTIWNDATVPFAETSVPPRQRAMGELVAQDRRTDLRALIDEIDAG